MTTIRLKVRGMTCDHCVTTLEKVLSNLPGVIAAKVDLANASAEVQCDPGRVNRGKMQAAIEDAGYELE